MIYLIYGNEMLLADSYKNQLKSLAKIPSLDIVQGSEITSDTYSFLESISLSGGKHVAFIDLDSLKSLDSTDFQQYFKKRSSGELVLTVKNVNRTTKIYKELAKSKNVKICECSKITNIQQLKSFIAEQLSLITNGRISFNDESLEAFIERSDYLNNDDVNCMSLINDIKVLACATNEPVITVELVCSCISDREVGNSFALSKLIANKDIAGLRKVLNIIPSDMTFACLGALSRELRIAWKSKYFSLKEIGAKYPSVFSKLSAELLCQCISVIMSAQDGIKNGTLTEKNALSIACINLYGIVNSAS